MMKVGDVVRVTSGPAFVPNGRKIKGRIEEITEYADGAEIMVRVASGGLWGFQRDHLTVAK